MSGFRYYKLHAITIPGGGYFEIAEFNLTNSGTRVSGGTLSASNTPTNSLSYFDSGVTSDRCYWSESVAEASGFYVQWDFGSAVAVDGCKFAGYDTATRYCSAFTVSGSNDGTTWTVLGSYSGISYPGNQTFTSIFSLLAPEVVSGTVLDDAGNPCARTVRLYNRSTGVLAGSTTSNASTGAFSFSVESGTYYAVVLDDDAGTQHNALIFDRVESVAS